MGCKGECYSWPSVRIGSKHAWYNGSARYCATCDKKVYPNGIERRVGAVFVMESYRMLKTTTGAPVKPNKCPCCHNTLRSTPVESRDLVSRKNKVYDSVPRMEAELIV